MKISVVTTLYCSEQYVAEFYRRTCSALQELGADYEIVFVNDGSPDDSLAGSLRLVDVDARVRVIDLARNFGHHPAILVGLQETTGDYVFLIDSDLEEAPENLVSFYHELVGSAQLDVVYGVHRREGEPWSRRWAGSAYYSIFNLLSDTNLPQNVVISRLMTRRFVDALLESWRWGAPPSPLMASLGFEQRPMEVVRIYKGTSTYSFRHKVSAFVNALTSFSARPLHYVFFLGGAVFALSIVMTCYAVIAYALGARPIEGWYTVFVSIWLIGGLSMMSMGVLGLYVARIFEQVKGRPVAVVRQRYVAQNAEAPPVIASAAESGVVDAER